MPQRLTKTFKSVEFHFPSLCQSATASFITKYNKCYCKSPTGCYKVRQLLRSERITTKCDNTDERSTVRAITLPGHNHFWILDHVTNLWIGVRHIEDTRHYPSSSPSDFVPGTYPMKLCEIAKDMQMYTASKEVSASVVMRRRNSVVKSNEGGCCEGPD